MKQEEILEALQRARTESKKRNFTQSIDFTMNFRNLDFKKAENQINLNVPLPHPIGSGSAKVAVFARDKNFASIIRDKVASVIMEDEIASIDRKSAELMITEYDAFLAEGPVMLTVAKYLGQILAPKGKMPKPITHDIKSFEAAMQGLAGSAKVSNKKGKFMPVVHVAVGNEAMADAQIAENIEAVYNAVLASLPGKLQNVKSMYVKLTMGIPSAILATKAAAIAEEMKRAARLEAKEAEAKSPKGRQKALAAAGKPRQTAGASEKIAGEKEKKAQKERMADASEKASEKGKTAQASEKPEQKPNAPEKGEVQ